VPLDWSAENAFAGAPVLPLRILVKGAGVFQPASVRLGWNEQALLILADLEDATPVSSATGDNQRLWTLGDVFEIFLRDTDHPSYAELHIAPTGHRLQLQFPSGEMVAELRSGERPLEDFIVERPLVDFRIARSSTGWRVLAGVPWTTLNSQGVPPLGGRLLASFSRYDYVAPDQAPTLSSTSIHEQVDFHRQWEWTQLDLVEAAG